MRALLLSICSLYTAMAFGQNFQIGHRTITFTDPSRSNRQIATEVYYPAATAGDNVAITGNNYPVVVFGHGFVMSVNAYQNVWEDLVPLGYVVCLPTTEGGIPPSHGDFGLDLAFVAETMQQRNNNDPTFFFYQKLAPTTALMGHSMGGGAAHLAAANNTNITCLVTFAPAETNPSAVTAAANIKVPTLTLAGANDCVTPLADHAGPIYNGIGSKCKTLVIITGASHCQFAESNFNCNFGEVTCSPGPAISRAQQHATQANYYVTFLNKYLKGSCSPSSDFDAVLAIGGGASSIQRTCMQQAGNNATVCPNTPVNLGSTNMDGYTFSWLSSPAGFSSNAQTFQVSPNSTTTYILTYTNQQSNCSIVDSITVNIPISAANAGNNAIICVGDTVELGTPILNYTYSWTSSPAGFTASTAQIAVSPTVNTNYYLTVADGTCTFNDTASVNIAPAALANITPVGATVFCSGGNVTLIASGGYAQYSWIPGGETGQSITVTEGGNYQVVVSNNSECIDTSEIVEINVRPTPFVEIVAAGPTEFCYGGNVVLSVDTGYNNYLWGPILDNTNQTIATQSGDYIVIVSAANGCTASDTITITEYPEPGVTILLINDTLSAVGNSLGGSYLWNFNGQTSTQTYFVPSNNGTYEVTFTDDNGCVATDSYAYTKTNINLNPTLNGVNVYPNPAQSFIKLDNNSGQILGYTLYNYAGQMVFSQQKTAQKSTEIDLNGLKSGIYLLKVENNTTFIYFKVVKI